MPSTVPEAVAPESAPAAEAAVSGAAPVAQPSGAQTAPQPMEQEGVTFATDDISNAHAELSGLTTGSRALFSFSTPQSSTPMTSLLLLPLRLCRKEVEMVKVKSAVDRQSKKQK